MEFLNIFTDENYVRKKDKGRNKNRKRKKKN